MKYFKSHSEFINEAKLSKVHKAAKQGSYPAVIVVVQDGKVIHQEPVSTPDVAPAAFNVMQKKYPKALLHLEDKTGKRLFSESVVNEAEKYITDEFKVGDKIKTNFGEWEVIETDYKPGKSFIAPFIFKGKDMKRVNIPNPPKTNKNAVGYKVTDGAKYPTIGFLYQYKDITKLATVGIDESVTEGTLKISGAAYDLWDEKEVQRKLRDVKIKIIGDIGGVATIKGNDKELQKVKDILGLEGAKESVNEAKFTKRSLMRAMKKDDGMIQLGNGQEYVIYNPNNGNDDNADMWQDKVIFGLDQDGEEHEIEYSDIVRYDESEVNEAFSKKDWDVKWKMPKDNLFNATKTTDAVNNRYNALQSLLKSKPKELKAFDADENHPAYDMTYDELMKWYNKLDESEVNEATDFNDPVLVAYRATSRDLPKLKIPKLKSRRLSFDKYMDLLDARLDVDQQIKDLRDEMAQTLRDMEQEAEPEGGEVADKYGSTMMKQEKEYTKLMAKKDKIMARIDKHRMA